MAKTPVADCPSIHLQQLIERRPQLAQLEGRIWSAYELLEETLRDGGTIYLAGNGGSAADAEHIASELLKGFEHDRPLTDEKRAILAQQGAPDLANHLQRGLRVIPFTSFVALRTAVNNDTGGEYEYAQLTWAFARPGDTLVCLTTSGNSINLIHAAHAAKAKNCNVLALTGKDGGQLASLCDLELRAPASRTLEVQELHLPIYHTLCLMLETAFFG